MTHSTIPPQELENARDELYERLFRALQVRWQLSKLTPAEIATRLSQREEWVRQGLVGMRRLGLSELSDFALAIGFTFDVRAISR